MSDRHQHHVLWHCGLLASSEHASILTVGDDRTAVEGRVVLPLGDVPCDITYRLGVDAGIETIHMEATVHAAGHRRQVVVDAVERVWTVDGEVDEALEGCTDIDLGWSPITNTIPMRRLGLDVGESAEITAAWFRFPELELEPNRQRYTRKAENLWRYQAGDFDFELVVDPESGLITKYGDDLWEAVAGKRT